MLRLTPKDFASAHLTGPDRPVHSGKGSVIINAKDVMDPSNTIVMYVFPTHLKHLIQISNYVNAVLSSPEMHVRFRFCPVTYPVAVMTTETHQLTQMYVPTVQKVMPG